MAHTPHTSATAVVEANHRLVWKTHLNHHHPIMSRLPVLLAQMLHNGKAGKLTSNGIQLGKSSPLCTAQAHRLLKGKRTARH